MIFDNHLFKVTLKVYSKFIHKCLQVWLQQYQRVGSIHMYRSNSSDHLGRLSEDSLTVIIITLLIKVHSALSLMSHG